MVPPFNITKRDCANHHHHHHHLKPHASEHINRTLIRFIVFISQSGFQFPFGKSFSQSTKSQDFLLIYPLNGFEYKITTRAVCLKPKMKQRKTAVLPCDLQWSRQTSAVTRVWGAVV